MSIEINTHYDVIVAGAGIAGISAAVKAGSMGVSVLLIEHYGFVGGMSTAGMVSPFMKHTVNDEPLVKGVFELLENEMRANKGMIDNGFYASSFRSSAFDLLSKANCHLLLNADIFDVGRMGNNLTELRVYFNGSQLTIKSKIFIDTSGDAQLLYLGNFPWTKGDERTGKLQALTLFFRMSNIDITEAIRYVKENRNDFMKWVENDFDPKRIISVAGYFSFVNKAIEEKRLSPDVQYIFFTTLPESGEASFNTSNILDIDASDSKGLTKAELTGRKQVDQVVTLLQNEIPGFKNSLLLETAVQVGVRETRRAIGEYAVTGDDIKKGRKFTDSIARGCYGIDIHGQKDEESRMEHLKEGDYYEIPLRSLLVKNSENLLVGGRCISATREGHSALRIMPTSAATGEACGAIAALSVINDLPLRQIGYEDLANQIKGNIS